MVRVSIMQATSAHFQPGLDVDFLTEVAQMLKTLGHPDRLRIVEFLENGSASVTEIHESLGIPQAVASQHLRQMFHLDILESSREGRRVIYSIANPLVNNMLHCLEESQRQHRQVVA